MEIYMKENGSKIKKMAKVLWIGVMDRVTMVIGKTIRGMVKASWHLKMDLYIMETGNTI